MNILDNCKGISLFGGFILIKMYVIKDTVV